MLDPVALVGIGVLFVALVGFLVEWTRRANNTVCRAKYDVEWLCRDRNIIERIEKASRERVLLAPNLDCSYTGPNGFQFIIGDQEIQELRVMLGDTQIAAANTQYLHAYSWTIEGNTFMTAEMKQLAQQDLIKYADHLEEILRNIVAEFRCKLAQHIHQPIGIDEIVE